MTVISRRTIDVLKNFCSINKSIVIKPGNKVSTLSINKNILATANVEETFESELAIYDLSAFLGGLSLFEAPTFNTTNKNFVLISDVAGKSKTKYFYSDPDIITQAPDRDIDLPTEDVFFTLKSQDLVQLQRAAAVYRVEDLCVNGVDGKISLCVTDKKNETSNTYSVQVGETDKEFCHCFKVENLKLLPGDYSVTISNPSVARFVGEDIKYFIALEP